MKIAILTCHPTNYSSARLKEAARQRGHTIRAFDTNQFLLAVKGAAPELFYKGKRFWKCEAILPRVGSRTVFTGVAVVLHLEQMAVPCLQSSRGLSLAHDKFKTMQVLSRHGIPVPDSVLVLNSAEVEPAIEYLGGAPVVIKFLQGTQGAGVMLAKEQHVAKAIIQALQQTQHRVLMQRFVAESSGRDIRAFVVGDRVVAAMRRIAKGSEFRSNVHLGASTERVSLPDDIEAVAVRAAHALGLGVAGVDILESDHGPLVMEVNSSPGLEGIEGTSQVDVAGEIIEHLCDRVRKVLL